MQVVNGQYMKKVACYLQYANPIRLLTFFLKVIFERRSEGDIGKGVEFLEDIGPEVNHKFVVVNEGPSGMPPNWIKIQWPVAFASGNQPLLDLLISVVKGNG